MFRIGQIFSLLSLAEPNINDTDLYIYMMGFGNAGLSVKSPAVSQVKSGQRNVHDTPKDYIVSHPVHDYSKYLENTIGTKLRFKNRSRFMKATATDLKQNDSKALVAVLDCIEKRYEDIMKGDDSFFYSYLASLIKYSLESVPNLVNLGKNQDSPDWINDYKYSDEYFKISANPPWVITVPFTIDKNRFNEVFKLQKHVDVEFAGKTSSLDIFTLPRDGGEFDFTILKKFFLRSAGAFALSRRAKNEMLDSGEGELIALNAIRHIYNRYPDMASRSKVIMEFLLHAVMECGLGAPKIFTNVELDSPECFDAECGGVYLLQAPDGMQLVFGLTSTDKDPAKAMERVVELSVGIKGKFQSLCKKLNSSFLCTKFANEEAYEIAKMIIPRQDSDASMSTTKSFGVFIGYEADLKDLEAVLAHNGYDQYVEDRLQERIQELEEAFKGLVVDRQMFGHSYYIYLLPFNELTSDLKSLIDEVLK